jgi:hypothetical protein
MPRRFLTTAFTGPIVGSGAQVSLRDGVLGEMAFWYEREQKPVAFRCAVGQVTVA